MGAEARGESKFGESWKPSGTMDEIRAFLTRQDKGRLVEILLCDTLEN